MPPEIPLTADGACLPRLLDAGEQVIEDCSRQAAQFLQAPWGHQERRADRRVPYPRLIPLTPLCDEGRLPTGETKYVVGKYLALRGLDFFHGDPLPERYVVVSLPCSVDRWSHFLLKVTWCRFLRPGWYDSGGRFIRLVQWQEPSQEIGDLTGANLSYAFDETLTPRCIP